MAASYFSGTLALPLQVHGRMLGGFQTDANGAYASLPVVGQAGAGGTPVADDATSGDALSTSFAAASGTILQALNYLDSQSGRTTIPGAGIAVASVGNTDQVSIDIESTLVPLGAHTVAASSVLAGSAFTGATGKFNITSLSAFQASDGIAASAGNLYVDTDGSTLGLNSASSKLEVKDLGISTAKIAAKAVTVAKIEDVAAGSLLVRDAGTAGVLSEFALATTQIMIGDGAGMTAAALSGDVTMANTGAVTIANDAVTTVKIKDENVTLAKIEDVAANSLLVRNANSAGVLSELALATTQIMIGDGTGMTAAALSGDITMTNAGVTSIGADKVITAKILDKNVTLAKIEDVAANSLLVRDSATGGVLSEFALATTQIMIGDGTGFTAAALSGDITMTNAGVTSIGADKVITAKILDKNVTLAKIEDAAANTVLVRDANSSGVLSAKAVADTQLLIGDGTGFTAAALSGDITMTNAGVTSIGATKVDNAMLNADVFTSDHDWTGVNTFDTTDLRIAGTQSSDGAKRQYSLKVVGDILIVTNEAAW